MKRFLSGLLTACLLAGVLLLTPLQGTEAAAAAGSQAKITVSSAEALPGDTVTLKVALQSNPGVAYLGIPLDYDDTYLEANPDTDFTGTGLGGWTIKKVAVWCEPADTTYTGDILSLTFRVKENAPAGTEIKVGPGTVEAWNAVYDAVDVSVEAGTITVSEAKHMHQLVKTDEKPATEAIDGHTAYWTCEACGKIFGDASGETEITIADTIIEAKGLTCLQVGDASGKAGDEIAVPVSLTENPGFAFLNFGISYDKTKLKLTGFEDNGLKGWMVGLGAGEKAVWSEADETTVTGKILTLKFTLLDDVADGTTTIKLTDIDAFNLGGDILHLNGTDGTVTIGDAADNRMPGDVTGDGKVNAFDLIRLKKHLADKAVALVENNADVTGDGRINGLDLIRLKKHLADKTVELK